MADHDAIVIGGGHNGLVCAAYLARHGLKPIVLERREIVGGAAVTEEITPGFRASTYSFLMSILHPRIIEELQLRQYGLEVMPCSDLLSPVDDHDYLVFSDNLARTQQSFARFSERDARALPDFLAALKEITKVFQALVWETPFDPTKRDWRTFKQVAGFARRNRKFGGKFFRAADIVTMSAYDFLSEWFEDDRVKALFGYFASIGTFAGPKTPGSAYVIMHHVMGEHSGAGGMGFIRGGMGAITQAMAAYGRTVGVEFALGAPVDRVIVENDRAQGVVTEAGREYRAPVIVSNASATTLFLRMVGEQHLPVEFVRDIRNLRTFSTVFKMNIACDRAPQYRCLDKARADGAFASDAYPTYVHIAPDIDYLERAYDDAKYGRCSTEPFLTPLVPSFVDPTLAPPGKHVVNIFGGHAPYKLRDGDWAVEKPKFERRVLEVLDRFAPGFSADIVAAQTFVPEDLERVLNLPQGNIFHAELTLDQIFFNRPAPHWADYRTPVQGLYQCGASVHPGGGVTGLPGYNAAREILRDLGRASSMKFA